METKMFLLFAAKFKDMLYRNTHIIKNKLVLKIWNFGYNKPVTLGQFI